MVRTAVDRSRTCADVRLEDEGQFRVAKENGAVGPGKTDESEDARLMQQQFGMYDALNMSAVRHRWR